MTDMELAYRKAEISKAWDATKDDPFAFNLWARKLLNDLYFDLMKTPGMTHEGAHQVMIR